MLRAIGNPNGEALLEVQRQAAKELKYIDDEEGKKKVVVEENREEPTAQNPLGL